MIYLNSDQKQVIYGTLLGNSQLRKTKLGRQLVMRSRCEEWLNAKVNFIKCLKGSFSIKCSNYYWISEPTNLFDEFYSSFYESEGNKFIHMATLDYLRDIAIMVWYGDVGCLVGRKRLNSCLRIQTFGRSSITIERYFNEIGAGCCINKVRGKPVLVFTYEGTKKLFNIIGPILHKTKYKLIPKF